MLLQLIKQLVDLQKQSATVCYTKCCQTKLCYTCLQQWLSKHSNCVKCRKTPFCGDINNIDNDIIIEINPELAAKITEIKDQYEKILIEMKYQAYEEVKYRREHREEIFLKNQHELNEKRKLNRQLNANLAQGKIQCLIKQFINQIDNDSNNNNNSNNYNVSNSYSNECIEKYNELSDILYQYSTKNKIDKHEALHYLFNKNIVRNKVSAIQKQIDEYKNNDNCRILLTSATFYGCGLNFELTTDIIILHNMTDERTKQVIGRAQRPGRTDNLQVFHLFYPNEVLRL